MKRIHLLAAELFGYSYDHYASRLGTEATPGNPRYEKMMPEDIETVEKAARRGWSLPGLAKALGIEEDQAESWLRLYREATDIVDAPTPAVSFRRGVRYSIRYAAEQGLDDEEAIEKLVTQICFRAADLGYLLDMEEERLSDYSEELRQEPD